jgi:hypothetical protein
VGTKLVHKKIAMAVIKIEVRTPKTSDHEKRIEAELKNRVVDKVSASFFSSLGTIECTYDEKRHRGIDKFRLERELKAAVKKLGYKIR